MYILINTFIFVSDLLRTDSLEILNVSGCGIQAEGGTSFANVLKSGCVKFKTLSLDVSNNDFGEAGVLKLLSLESRQSVRLTVKHQTKVYNR